MTAKVFITLTNGQKDQDMKTLRLHQCIQYTWSWEMASHDVWGSGPPHQSFGPLGLCITCLSSSASHQIFGPLSLLITSLGTWAFFI